jgi:hypothetical protein
MSANAQARIRIARNFAKEAYWDLQVAKRLMENLKLDTCSNNDEVFYIGRRVLSICYSKLLRKLLKRSS